MSLINRITVAPAFGVFATRRDLKPMYLSAGLDLSICFAQARAYLQAHNSVTRTSTAIVRRATATVEFGREVTVSKSGC
jgi:hypothetical protein